MADPTASIDAPADGHSTAVENYLKAIWALQSDGDPQAPGAVRTNDLAEELDVRAASVSTMVGRLEQAGLVSREPYHGVKLTADGQRVALAVIRRHRLVELFLAEALQLPWDVVHVEAERLEHHISPRVEAAIAAHLGEPTHDPHGDPIPTAALELPAPDGSRPLSELADGSTGELVRVSDRDPAMLRYLAERGIGPGCRVEVVTREPFGGPLRVSVDGTEHLLGEPLAHAISVLVAGD